MNLRTQKFTTCSHEAYTEEENPSNEIKGDKCKLIYHLQLYASSQNKYASYLFV